MKENKMREIEIEKVILSIGATGEELEKAVKLLKLISGRKAIKTKSRKRIPAFGIRPGLEIGCKVTLRGKEGEDILKKLLEAIDNKLKEKQIRDADFSFGINEYIEIPGMEFQRDIGLMGLGINVVFKRKGKRVEIKKIKKGKKSKRQQVTRDEILEFMKNKFKIKILVRGGEEI